MDRFASMRAFAAVVDSGSFVRAAERLNLSTSSLSRLVTELEAHLGVRLLQRTTRKLSLTDIGQSFYERCVLLLADLDEAEAFASQSASAPRGRIKLTCPFNLVEQRMGPAIAAFVARYPEVNFDVTVADRVIDLVEEGFDLAVRIGTVGSDRLVARKLGTTSLLLCASPDYVRRHGEPRKPADLLQHNVLTYAYSPSPKLWRLRDAEGAVHEVRVDGSLHANNGDLLLAAARAGLGLVFEPDFMLDAALREGSLRRVMPDYGMPPLEMWAVYPGRRHLSHKLRLFVDFLADRFAQAARELPAERGRASSSARKRATRKRG